MMRWKCVFIAVIFLINHNAVLSDQGREHRQQVQEERIQETEQDLNIGEVESELEQQGEETKITQDVKELGDEEGDSLDTHQVSGNVTVVAEKEQQEQDEQSQEVDENVDANEEEEQDLDQADSATNETTSVNATKASEEAKKLKYSPRKVLCKQRVFAKTDNNDTAVDEESWDKETQQVSPVEGVNIPVEVRVVNGSLFARLLSEQNNSNVTNRSMAAQCSLGFFYASWCPFSAAAAPHFNALPRLFPDLDMLAVDTGKHHSINAQFGVLALPTIILFHNSKAVAKYNMSEYQVGQFASYVTYFTGLEPAGEPGVLEEDYEGPVPTVQVPVPDYYLYLAWAFIVVCALGYFIRSSLFIGIIDTIRKTWQEAEIHHEHED